MNRDSVGVEWFLSRGGEGGRDVTKGFYRSGLQVEFDGFPHFSFYSTVLPLDRRA